MSRIERLYVWQNYFINQDFLKPQKCPICGIKDIHYTESDWERAHIFSISSGGADVFPNLMPMCCKCNGSSNKERDLYTYLVKIGKLDQENADLMRKTHKNQIEYFDPICEHTFISTKLRCPNRKKNQYSPYCNKCSSKIENGTYIESMDFELNTLP